MSLRPRKPRDYPQWRSLYRDNPKLIDKVRRATWRKLSTEDTPTIHGFCVKYDVDEAELRRFLMGIDYTVRGKVSDEFIMSLASIVVTAMPSEVVLKILEQELS